MREISNERLLQLVADPRPPCVSLYQPTHRRHPENQQDPIRYRTLLREAERALRASVDARTAASLLERFRALEQDRAFWNARTDGLAVLGSAAHFELFELQRTVPERVVVAESFHVKPLLRILQSADRYQILGLTRTEVMLFEGNRDALDPVQLTEVPTSLTDALGSDLTEPSVGFHSVGRAAIRHGSGAKKDEIDVDTERFFQIVDRAILEHHSQPTRLPLVLAALPQNQGEFRKLSRNPFLLPEGIDTDPNALSTDELQRRTWRIIEPFYLQRLAELVDRYRAARGRGLGADDLALVAEAAVAGRIDTLLVEAERVIPVRIERTTGGLLTADNAAPLVDDALDDLAELVLLRNGEVVVVPAQRMPSETGAAAIYRF